MATKRMLIDATHPEETRVVVVDGNRLEELEFESAARKQLKGNIYLAKVTRVEPSLQAAFVEYGGNRHGFLAFNEIHPDYYQIPVADREEYEAEVDENSEDGEPDPDSPVEESGADDSEQVEHIRPKYRNARRYKIQEVIKKRQILLVQVVKEERGNKGAALTTYLSLAGRYCVLMPNTDKGGGISRKISNVKDRKRLKSVLSELSIPKGTAVIVRTAGAERSKAEIKRDFEYLMRLWSNIRDVTLQSQAPALIYEEANLIKRSIRDMYSRDIDEVQVEGEDGYRIAKDFMKMLIPSHAKKVQPYRDPASIPLYHRYQVEGQLDAMHSAIVQLPSGGYIVINPTEALVAIDVNSGRSTKERNIEETALKTNLEAADEIARSLRLRDLAGLVVVDFIDMEINRNQMAVERRMKEATKNDRARIQIGRISPFGLLEMSRQRLRPSFTETSTETCHYCHGTGVRRSLESTVLHVLRVIEEEGIRRRSDEIIVHVPTQVALYILNQKRDQLAAIEERYQMEVQLSGDDSLVSPEYKLERLKSKPEGEQNTTRPLGPEDSTKLENIRDEVLDTAEDDEEGDGRKRRRRRRRRRKPENQTTEELSENLDDTDVNEEIENNGGEDDDEKPRKRRRRGKRGGRRRSRRSDEDELLSDENAISDADDDAEGETDAEDATDDLSEESDAIAATSEETESDEKSESRSRRRPRRRGMRRRRNEPREDTSETVEAQGDSEIQETEVTPAAAEMTEDPVAETETPKPRRRSRRKSTASEVDTDDVNEVVSNDSVESSEETKPKRRRRTSSRKSQDDTLETPETAPDTNAAEPVSASPTDITPEPFVAAPVQDTPAEPVVETQAVMTTAVTVKTADGDTTEVGEDKPKRRGWWSK